MKKVFSLIAALLIAASLACTAFAADFVPSISEKGSPVLVLIDDDQGNKVQGKIVTDGEDTGFLGNPCLVVTAVADAETSTLIPDDAAKLLLEVYAKLKSGEMKLPYEKISPEIDPEAMVIRDLFDVSWLCGEHPVVVAPKGVCVELIFDLNLGKDTEVYAMSYKNGEWSPIVSCVNNGDGTVTCVFEDFCPVAFAVPMNSISVTPAPTGDGANLLLWGALATASVAGLVVLITRRKNER